MKAKLIKNYRNDHELRESFNELANIAFGISFKTWYENGYWNEDYIPFSFVEDGKVLANVSVNTCDMRWDGHIHHMIQIGTVMTHPDHRHKGYIRLLMEEIEKDYGDKVEGMYLFANDTVLEFYPKFGYRMMDEYQCSKAMKLTSGRTVTKVPMKDKSDWDRFKLILDTYDQDGEYVMTNDSDLYMYYMVNVYTNNVYYIPDTDTYVVAVEENGSLNIKGIWSRRDIDIDEVIAHFGSGIQRVTLSFTPKDRSGYEEKKASFEDTTLFVKGKVFENWGDKKFMFQELSHA